MKPILNSKYRSKLEADYASRLELLKCSGEIVDYLYEPMSINIGNGAKYKPDFLVIFSDRFEVHETKGFKRAAGIVRLKAAAKLLPWFKFVLVTRNKSGWQFKTV